MQLQEMPRSGEEAAAAPKEGAALESSLSSLSSLSSSPETAAEEAATTHEMEAQKESWMELMTDLLFVSLAYNCGYIIKGCGVSRAIRSTWIPFFASYGAWLDVTLYANRFEGYSDGYHFGCYALSALGIFLMVLNSNDAGVSCAGLAFRHAAYARGFLVGFGCNRVAVVALNAMAYRSNRDLSGSRTDAALAFAETVALVVAAARAASGRPTFSIVVWLLGLRIAWNVLEIVVLQATALGTTVKTYVETHHSKRAPIHEEHLIGRHTAITMVMLGEAVLQLTTGFSTLDSHESATYRFSVSGFILVFALAVLTFNTIPEIQMHALGRSKKRGAIWRILSAASAYFILLVGCAIKLVELDLTTSFVCVDDTEHHDDHAHDDAHATPEDDHDDHGRRGLAAAALALPCPKTLVKRGHASFLAFTLTGAMACYLLIRMNHKGLQLENRFRLAAYAARALVALGHLFIYSTWRDNLSADTLMARHAAACVVAVALDVLFVLVDFLLVGTHIRDHGRTEFAHCGDEDYASPTFKSIKARFSHHITPMEVVQRAVSRRRQAEATLRSLSASLSRSYSQRSSEPDVRTRTSSLDDVANPVRKSADAVLEPRARRTSSVDARDGSFVDLRASSVDGAPPRHVHFAKEAA